MTPQERGALGAAIKDCRSTGYCLYPKCKTQIAQCWTADELREVGLPGDLYEDVLNPPREIA